MRELEELIPQMEALIQDKSTLEEQVNPPVFFSNLLAQLPPCTLRSRLACLYRLSPFPFPNLEHFCLLFRFAEHNMLLF